MVELRWGQDGQMFTLFKYAPQWYFRSLCKFQDLYVPSFIGTRVPLQALQTPRCSGLSRPVQVPKIIGTQVLKSSGLEDPQSAPKRKSFRNCRSSEPPAQGAPIRKQTSIGEHIGTINEPIREQVSKQPCPKSSRSPKVRVICPESNIYRPLGIVVRTNQLEVT